MRAPEFDWDLANTGHIALHGISPLEVEQCVLDDRALLVEIQSEQGEERIQLVGLSSAGRILTVIFAMRGSAVRPVTSYTASRSQQLEYLRQWES